MTSIESFYMQMPQLSDNETELDLAILAEAIGQDNLLGLIDSISGVNSQEQEK